MSSAWSYDTKQAGSRLLPVLIDERARDEPDLACFSLPYDDDDLSRGYEDIGYAAAANAINKLAWFIESRAGRSSTFETVAYLGVPDIRYHLMQMAVCKTGHKVLFSSQQNSTDIHVSLMEMTQCRTLLSAAGVHVGDILSARAMAHHVVPGLDELLDKEVQASLFPYTKTYADAALDPYMILHTSGSTGLPKPVEYNHAGVAVMDRHVFLPDTDDKEHVRIFCRPGLGARYLLLSSPYHFMSAVTGPVAMVFGRAVLVTGFRHKAPTPSDIFGILEHSRVSFTCLNPWLMEDVARHQNAASYIKPLTMVGVGGSVLSKFASDVWGRHTRIQNFWGTTETAGPPHYVAPNEDAAYVYIDCQHGGLDFRRVEVDYSEGDVAVPVFESVFVLTEKSAPYSVWHALRGIRLESGPPYPEFHVGDLWTPHPDAGKAAFAWRFVSRKDDVIVLSTGLNLHPGPMERVLAAQRLVRSAIVVGMRRRQPLALIELGEDVTVQDADGLWSQVIAPQNEREVAHGRIGEKHVLLVPAGGFVRTASKGSVVRRKTEEKFAAQIDEIYDRYGDREQDNEKQRYGSVG